MITLSDNGTLAAMQERLTAMLTEIPAMMIEAGNEIGDMVVSELAAASPVSAYEGPPPGDDAPGHLRDSFSQQTDGAGGGVTVTVSTSQSVKLGFVVNGRGDVYPVTARALFWPGLGHPVMHAGPSQPNDFVTPVTDAADVEASQIMTDALDGLLGAL